MRQQLIFTHSLETELTKALSECSHERIFVLMDTHTHHLCWPKLHGYGVLRQAIPIVIQAGDAHKNLSQVEFVWRALQQGGATRHACLVNIGGGMVTDLGGFAASTYKRGIDFINIPTTLLAMVDASVGGKTGVNFGGLKNEVGVFCDAKFVIIDTNFLQSLDRENLLSGYAEMLKHGLLANNDTWAGLLNFNPLQAHVQSWLSLVKQSVQVKADVVENDHLEQGLRKSLNLGHTFGHAFESFSLKRNPILHGYAVAYGLVCELYLSCIKSAFPTQKMRQTVRFITSHYGQLSFTCDDYNELIELMRHDKKNKDGRVNCSLLHDVGQVHLDQYVSEDEIKAAFDFYREGE